MDAMGLLHTRSSQPKLQHPAPQSNELTQILQAGLRAPDHGALTPWQFVVCYGAGLERLGRIYQEAAIKANKTDAEIEKACKMPLRAPMIIVAIAKCQAHPKVPVIEQVESAACAVYAMELAACAQGFGAMWRTGELANDRHVRMSFGLAEQDEIVGFLYLGTPSTQGVVKPQKPIDKYVEYWD